MDKLLSEQYANDLDGVLSCYDRMVITGSLQPFCYAQGMTQYLYQQGIRIFDYAQFAEPLREHIRENAEALAQANGVKIEFVRKKDFRKENSCPTNFEEAWRSTWLGAYLGCNGGVFVVSSVA